MEHDVVGTDAVPTIPGWIPPLDTGQPNVDDLNDLSVLPKVTFAARNTIIPIVYGRDRIFGRPFVVHIDEDAGFLYVAYGFCEGEIAGFETVFVDSLDVNDATDGFLTFAGAATELHTGVAGQATSTLLSGAIAGYVDTAPDLAYVVLKVPQNSTRGFPRCEAIIQGRKVFDPRAYNLLADTRGDPQFVNAEDTSEETAQWFSDSTINESATIADDSWTSETSDPSPAASTYAEIIDNSDGIEYLYSRESPVDIAKDYTVKVLAKQPTGDRFNYLMVVFIDANGDNIQGSGSGATGWTSLGTYFYWEIANSIFPTSWTQFQFDFGPSAGADATIPVGAVSMRIGGLFTRNGTVGTNTTVRISDYRIFEGLKEVEQVESDVTTWLFTQNPTVCFRDMVANFSGWDILDQGVIDNAQENDALVGGIKRREIGLTIAKPDLIDKWAKAFRVYMGAFLGWEQGKIRVIPNRPDVEAAGAVVLDGTASTLVDMGDAAELDFTETQDFTVECAFKMGSTTGITQCLISKKLGLGTSTAGYTIYVDTNDQLVGRINDGTTNAEDRDTTTDFFDNEWHHAGLIIDQVANELILVVDTVARTPIDISSVANTLVNAEEFRIGANGAGTERGDAIIDEVRVWNDVRTSTEISDNAVKEISNPLGDASLIGYWKLNEAISSTTAVDSSISGNDGTLTGAAVFGLGNQQIIPHGVAVHLTADDILKDSLQLTRRSLRSVPNSVAVDYEDSSGSKWHTERVQSDTGLVTSGAEQRRLSRVSLPGIHNASQAQREATERLNWYITDLEAKLTVFDPGWNLQNGSIVAVTHPIGLDAKLFRLRGLTAKSGRWTLDLVEYDPAIYSNEVIANPTTPDVNLGNPLRVPTPAGLSLVEELFKYKNGLTGSRVRASWTASNYPFLSQYKVEGYVDGTLVWQTTTQANSVVTPGVEELVSDTAVTYEIRVSIQSPFAEGDVATDTVSILGKLAVPGNVPTLQLTQTNADTVDMVWGEAVDIDIWRYEIRLGDPVTNDTWEEATKLELVDGLNYTTTGLAVGSHRLFVKARDSVGNESVTDIHADITLSVPDAVASLNGFEVASEVRLNWPAVTTGFVERYRIAFSDIPETFETTLDTVDTLRFSTKDVPEGTFRFKIFSLDKNGIEATTAATLDIEVTSDADAFLADSFDFVSPALTNMVEFDLRLQTPKLYVTHMADVFKSISPSDFNDESATPLANYHSTGASEWLSETKDFGLLLTGSWNLTHDVTVLDGTVTIELELSTDDITYVVFTGAAKGDFRYARVRISTFNPPGEGTSFVKSPLMNLKINVVPLEESGEATSSGVAGNGKTINLVREYTALKEIVVQPKNTIASGSAVTAIVDNIVIGPNTGIKFDGVSFLSTPDDALFDFGTGDFTIEFWAKNDSSGVTNVIVAKKNTSTSTGYSILQTGGEGIRVKLDDGSVDLTINSTGNAFPDDGQYHHIAVIVNRATDLCKIRIDKVEEANGDISTLTGSMDNSIALTVGARAFPNAEWSGTIDDLRVWSDVRTNAEIDDNQDAPLDMTVTQTNLVGYWLMDGGVGVIVTTVADETVNGNTFTETGAGTLTYVDPGAAGNLIQKINSFDVFIFDIFGQQLAEQFQWKWKAV